MFLCASNSAAGLHKDTSGSLATLSNGLSNGSFLDESSVTSVLYLKAKGIYKMRKFFNARKLKVHFDAFLIKTYAFGFSGRLFHLESLRLVKMHQILSRAVRAINEKVFGAFLRNSRHRTSLQKTLCRIASKRGLRDMSFGMRQWQNFTEKSLKSEMR